MYFFKSNNMIYTIGIVLFTFCVRIDADFFSSIADMELLFVTENITIDSLELYIHKQEEILSTLKRYLHNFKREHDKAKEDISNYMSNPINAFTFIKRLTIDLNHLSNNIKMGKAYLKKIYIRHDDVLYPAMEDLTGAAQGLARLQKIYRLDVKDLAEGNLNGVAYSTPPTASDCYELGRVLYNEAEYKNARAWLFEAFQKYYKEDVLYPFTDNDILEYINKTCHKLGDSTTALKWTQKLLDINPANTKAKEIVAHYLQVSKSKRLNSRSVNFKDFDKDKDNYEALCRGDLEIPSEVSNRLTCRYLSENHPFLLIAPFKIEMLYLKPDVVLFHQVLSDGEIKTIKRLARPKFKRAKVIHQRTGKPMNVSYRISKEGCLQDTESSTVARISRRVTLMTGLSTETAEYLQVLNYGIGGHYIPHYDFFQVRDNILENLTGDRGDRIATVLFYASDVAHGGATVFTRLGLSVAPVKGSAILFYNLLVSGKQDFSTKHGACPVLQGSKWVVTKWLRQVGQELLKPCSTKVRKEFFSRKVPSPVPKISKQI